MPKVITVFGATGKQGGAVARALVKNPQFKVEAVTRDVSNPKIESLKSNGVDVLQCDFSCVDSIRCTLNNSDACFVVTYTDFADPNCIENEIQVGKNITDACVAAGIKHVVLSTQMHTIRIIGFAVRQFCAKAEIEDYMLSKNLTLTKIMVPPYYEDFYDVFKPLRVDSTNFKLAIPMGQMPLNIISVDDIGEVVNVIMQQPEKYADKTISVSGDKLTIWEMADILSRYLAPLQFKDKQISLNAFSEMNFVGARDWATMFDFFLRVDQRYNVGETKKLNPHTLRFHEWVKLNSESLKNAFLQ